VDAMAQGPGHDQIPTTARARVMGVAYPASFRAGLAGRRSDSGLDLVACLANGATGLKVADEPRTTVEVKVRQCVRGIVELPADHRGDVAVRAIRNRIV
jgi:hypothetical protein